MIAFAYYLLKVIICSGILYSYYLIALRNKAFHYYNRFYLLCTVMISLLLPLARISVEDPAVVSPVISIPLVKVVNSSDAYVESFTAASYSPFQLTDYLSIGYLIISSGLCALFLFTLWQIRNMIRRYDIVPMDGIAFLNTSEKGTPFSFLNYIFWNREIPADSVSGRQILLHEVAHVRQHHSYDKIFMQCLLMIFWANPFFWLIRKELTMIHEFIADREAVKDQDTAAFAAMILQAAFPSQPFAVTNYFFNSPIKRRLQMLINSNKPGRSYFNRIMVLPILFIIGAGFTLKVSEKPDSMLTLSKVYTIVIDAGHGGEDGGANSEDGLFEKDFNLAIAKKIRSLNTDNQLQIVLTRETDTYSSLRKKMPQILSANPDLLISIHINAAPNNTARGFEIYISNSKTTLESENIALASAIQNAIKPIMLTGSELRRRQNHTVFLLDSVAKNFPAVLLECGFITNPQDLEFLKSPENIDKMAAAILSAVKKYLIQKDQGVAYTEPDKSSTAENNAVTAEKIRPSIASTDTIHIIADSIVLYTGNRKQSSNSGPGKGTASEPISLIARDQLTVINDTLPKGVKSVDFTEAGDVIVIFNNGKAERMSTSEAQKKGYVPLAIQEKKQSNINFVPGVRIQSVNTNPIFIVNGVRLKKESDINDLNKIVNPEDIESLEILKGQSAVDEFGEEAKDGVVLIKTKNFTGSVKEVTVVGYASKKPFEKEVTVVGYPSKKAVKTEPVERVAEADEVEEVRQVEKEEPLFKTADIDPSFKGGQKALNNFIYPKLDAIAGSDKKDYVGECTVQFIVEKNGAVTDVSVLQKDGTSNAKLGNALAGILKSSPAWLPAIQNGQKVRLHKILNFKYPPVVILK